MKCKLMVGIAGVLFKCVAAFSSTVDKPCPVVPQELDICAVIANAANYDGKEVTVSGIYRGAIHGSVFSGRSCPNDPVNMRLLEHWQGEKHAVEKVRSLTKKNRFREVGEVIRGTFRVAREGQCFGQDCWLYEIEESDLLCATANTWDFNLVSRPSPGSTRDADVPTEAPSSTAADYFPPGMIEGFGSLFGAFFNRFDEPSLLALARDTNAVSYRFESIAGQSGRMLTVRLSMNPDGTAETFATDWFVVSYSSGASSRAVRETHTTASAPAVERFLQKVEEADFWTMPADVPIPTDAKGRPKFYVTDSDTYVFEGVRGGKYHVVIRSWQDSPPFTEMVDELVLDIARLRGSAIPRRQP